MNSAPRCIGIILDGNRRWAKERGLSSAAGHQEGSENLKRCIEWVAKRGIAHLAVFAFSSENWGRSPNEVAYLMDLMAEVIAREAPALRERGVKVRIIGEREKFPASLAASVARVEESTANGTALTLWVCLSYGSRAEIVAAARAVSGQKEITESSLAGSLWSAGMPDPDMVIRTGGRRRLSNFLLWQAAYSELFFTDTLWPDFGETELQGILDEYAARARTFGI